LLSESIDHQRGPLLTLPILQAPAQTTQGPHHYPLPDNQPGRLTTRHARRHRWLYTTPGGTSKRSAPYWKKPTIRRRRSNHPRFYLNPYYRRTPEEGIPEDTVAALSSMCHPTSVVTFCRPIFKRRLPTRTLTAHPWVVLNFAPLECLFIGGPN